MQQYILALDQGTTSSRSIVFDAGGNIVATAQKEFTQHFPQPGWVEHDAMEIWETQLATAKEVIAKAAISCSQIAAIGITNQRETAVVWDRNTGKPVYNAIVWQDRRTADFCDELKARALDKFIQQRTGLVVDSYFSGTKIRWILDNVPGARERAIKGELCFGTIDTWLLWNLTSGQIHATDVSNASRTMLCNLETLQWDGERFWKYLAICCPKYAAAAKCMATPPCWTGKLRYPLPVLQATSRQRSSGSFARSRAW
jgi:glycerol kinase